MKKRKKQAHLNIKLAKGTRRLIRWHQSKLPNFAAIAKCTREIIGQRTKQKRRMYRYLERKGKI